ncbi:villin-4 [Phtheirospermum japonicum]|uniref:Villin-4 n=1 Tax=Phtheirospermum japonicum TaxID=374723 RepID=A0A830DAR6_9LAMI|nr:villin-4 [Phtheirospermum japonicum]
MSVSMKDVDPAFQGAGQKAYPNSNSSGIEIWRIENFHPVTVPKSSHGKFFTGDSYVILKTTALKNGGLRHDIHYWLGKDTSQDESGTAAIKTIELDAALGGRAVQYRELQGHETEKFLSYFKPCIIPQEGGVASGFKHAEADEHQTRLFVCKGKHVVQVKEVPFARTSLNHDDIFILDTKSKIFQFNGSNSSIQERAKALEVVQYIKDTYHDGKCEIAAIEDGRLMADAETGEFWGFFGGFAPLPKKSTTDEAKSADNVPSKLFSVEKGEAIPIEASSWTRELLDTHKCFIFDCGIEVFIWMGRNTSLNQRKAASSCVDELLRSQDRSKSHVTRVIEGFETVIFRSKFDSWPQTANVTVSEEGRGKVAALLKRQGINVKGLLKAETPKEETQLFIDCTGDLKVWRVNGQQKTLLSEDQSKFYSGDCYIFQYNYPGEEKDEHLIGTWFGKHSVEEDQVAAVSQASKMVESMKFVPTQARIHEGNEPLQFFAIFQSFIVFKGGLSKGYKNYIAEKELQDETYSEDGLALFRVQGSGPENMQAIQVDPVASSLNSSYCYILHSGSTVFTWCGNLTTSEAQELAERQLDLIRPNSQSKLQKEGAESEQFWDLLGGKSEYLSQKIARKAESDPHLFSCTLTKGDLKVTEVHNFNQDDLMTEDVCILDCQSDIYVWVGQNVESKYKTNALNIGEIHGNSFQRKLAILKNGGAPVVDKPKRRAPVSNTGRSAVPDKSQRSRSMSFSPDRVRVRGRSPAFNALAATFESPNARNMSTPPPIVRKIYPKSVTPDSGKLPSRSAAIAALTSTFEQPPPARQLIIPRSPKVVSPEVPKPRSETISRQNSVDELKLPKPEPIQEDVKENETEDDEGLPIYPYDRLKTSSTDPVPDIDVTKRETYLSSTEFKEKFGMAKDMFYKLPKWKQNKLKMSLQLF